MIRTFLLNRNDLENIKYDDSVFSEGRKAKIEKIKFEEDKQLSACVELALIYALKQLDPDIKLPLVIKEEENGKLLLETEVAGMSEIHFNLSHAKDWAVATVSDKNVGVDVEYAKTRTILAPNKILHPDEFSVFGLITNEAEKKKYFYECWVTKESYLKQLGIGLIVKPRDFLVYEDKLIVENGQKLKKRYVHVYKSEEIKGADWKFDSGYRLAVCSPAKDSDSKASVITAEDINKIL